MILWFKIARELDYSNPVDKAHVRGHYRTNPKTKESYYVPDYYDKRKLKEQKPFVVKSKKRVNASEQELSDKKRRLEEELALHEINEQEALASHGSKYKGDKLHGKDFYAGHSLEDVLKNVNTQKQKVLNQIKQIEADLKLTKGLTDSKTKKNINANTIQAKTKGQKSLFEIDTNPHPDTTTKKTRKPYAPKNIKPQFDIIKAIDSMREIGKDKLRISDPPITKPGPYKYIYQNDIKYREAPVKVGDIISVKAKDLNGKPRFITVTGVSSQQHDDDGLSKYFKYDDVWYYEANARKANREEIEKYILQNGYNNENIEYVKRERLKELANNIKNSNLVPILDNPYEIYEHGKDIYIDGESSFYIADGQVFLVTDKNTRRTHYNVPKSKELMEILEKPIANNEIEYVEQVDNSKSELDIEIKDGVPIAKYEPYSFNLKNRYSSSGKTWVAQITGLHPRYILNREFIESTGYGGKYDDDYEIKEVGLYANSNNKNEYFIVIPSERNPNKLDWEYSMGRDLAIEIASRLEKSPKEMHEKILKDFIKEQDNKRKA